MKKERIKAWFSMTKGEIKFLVDFFMCMYFMGCATVIALNYDTMKMDAGLWLPLIMIVACCLGFALSWTLLMYSNEDR